MKLTRKKIMGINVFLFIFIMLFVICLGALIFLSIQEGIYMEAAIEFPFLCIVCALEILFVRGLNRWEVQFNENDMVFTPFFGAPRTIPYRDIQKINTGGSGYILYNSDGKRLLIFDDFRFENASQAILFLKSKGIKTEM